MSQYFMDNIGLRGIVGILDIPEILSRAEDLKSKGVQKFSLTQNSVCGFDSKASFLVKVVREFSELRYFLGYF